MNRDRILVVLVCVSPALVALACSQSVEDAATSKGALAATADAGTADAATGYVPTPPGFCPVHTYRTCDDGRAFQTYNCVNGAWVQAGAIANLCTFTGYPAGSHYVQKPAPPTWSYGDPPVQLVGTGGGVIAYPNGGN